MKNTIALKISIPFLLLTLIGTGQTATFLSNFEDQNIDAEIGGASFEGGGEDYYEVVANPLSDAYNSSNYVLKVYTGPGAGGRAEYRTSRLETNEKTYIYTWKRFFPKGMFTDVDLRWCLQNQWKTWPCEAATSNSTYEKYEDLICGGGGIFNEIELFEDMNTMYRARAYPNCKNDYDFIQEGMWHEFTLEIYWTETDNGYYRIWRNDTLFGYSDNMKTLFDDFLENTCDIYWTTGLYTGWAQTGGMTKDTLIAYLDDIAIYDIDKGFTIADVCPGCEVAPIVPMYSNVYKINMNYGSGAPDGYSNSIKTWGGDTSAIDISSTFGQNNGIDIYMTSNMGAAGNLSTISDECFPYEVIRRRVSWSTAETQKIQLKDLNPNNTYTFKVLAAHNRSGATQIWTTESNRDTINAYNNICGMAEITNLVPDANGDLTINAATVDGSRAYINAIEIVEYVFGNTSEVCDYVNWDLTADITHATEFDGSDGAIDLTVSGGFGNYTYYWNNGAATQDINELIATTYYVTITDDSSCTIRANYTLTQPADPCDAVDIMISGAVTPDTSSKGVGTIYLNVTGGTEPYTFSWSNGETSQDISGLTNQAYTFTVTDQSGCTNTESFLVTNYTPCSIVNIIIDGTVTPDTSSKGVGAINLNVTGGTEPFTYTWWRNSETSQDISGLTKGSYPVTVTDKNGCFSSVSFKVNDYNP